MLKAIALLLLINKGTVLYPPPSAAWIKRAVAFVDCRSSEAPEPVRVGLSTVRAEEFGGVRQLVRYDVVDGEWKRTVTRETECK